MREETRTRLGADFDLTTFHIAILDHGTMRLDLLRGVTGELLTSRTHR